MLRFVDVSDGCRLNVMQNESFYFLRKNVEKFSEISKFMGFHEF